MPAGAGSGPCDVTAVERFSARRLGGLGFAVVSRAESPNSAPGAEVTFRVKEASLSRCVCANSGVISTQYALEAAGSLLEHKLQH